MSSSGFQGPVLARNQARGITHTIENRRNPGSVQLPDLDPLTCPISQWLNATRRPYSLVSFYFAQMARNLDEHGQVWVPPLGYDHSTYLRAASTLLDAGPEVAIRTILWAMSKVRHPPSLQWIAKKIAEVEKCLQANSTTPTQSKPVVMSLL